MSVEIRAEPQLSPLARQITQARAAEMATTYTIDQLIEQFGGGVSRRQIQRWADDGLLPAPDRRAPEGATDGIARALYPWWTVHVLHEIMIERARGTKLVELRATAAERIEKWRNDPLVHPGVAIDRAVRVPSPVSRALQRAAWDYAERHAREFGQESPRAVTLSIHDGAGNRTTIEIGHPPAGDDE